MNNYAQQMQRTKNKIKSLKTSLIIFGFTALIYTSLAIIQFAEICS
jgi:hypothetical protein